MIVCRNHSDFRISMLPPLLYYGRGAFFVSNESAGSHQACLYDRFMTNARNVLENISHKARKEAAMIYQKVSADMKFVDREKEVEKFWNEEDGMGVVEIVLITVVLIGLVIIFKSQITSLVNKLLSKMTSQANKI